MLIMGASGTGKSSLSLILMAYGARLVSDDRTSLTLVADRIHAAAPVQISGLIEARGVGILSAEPLGSAFVSLVVDLDVPETERLPEPRTICLLGQSIPLLHNAESPHFAAAILQYLKTGAGRN